MNFIKSRKVLGGMICFAIATLSLMADDNIPGDITVKNDDSSDQYAIGARIEVFGGLNLAQSGDVTLSTPLLPGQSVKVSTHNQVGGVAGIKAGYTWPDWNAIGGSAEHSDSFVNGKFKLLPSLDEEFFWTNFKYKGQGTVAGSSDQLNANINAFVFSVDPTLRMQVGPVRPYVGLGMGGAYIYADGGSASVTGLGSTNLTGHSDDFCFVLQGLAGVEVFLARNWALNLDYKYLDFIDPSFNSSGGNIPITYKSDGIGQHIVTAGLSCYF